MYHFPNESEDYRAMRARLLDAEIALRDQREQVAALRRALPAGPLVEDYVFEEGPRDLEAGDTPLQQRPLSALFEDPDKPLVLVHFMLGKAQSEPCPMCTLWADGYAGVAHHLAQRVNLAVLVAGQLETFRDLARRRGWRDLRLLSAGESSIKRDLGVEGEDGSQMPAVSVFTREPDGRVRHAYSGGALLGEGQYRGLDLMVPVWHVLDLTPEGRGDWLPRLAYD